MNCSILVSFLLMLSLAAAEDLMAVCYSFTTQDMCTPNNAAGGQDGRYLLAEQGTRTPEAKSRRRLYLNTECGAFCAGWATFCAEYKCDADTLGMSCEEVIAEAKEHFQEIATSVGTEDCMKQMDPNNLECMCVDQDN